MSFQYSPRFYRAMDGGPPLVRSYPEYTGSAFVAGDIVYWSAGTARVAADDTTTLLGMAMKPGLGTTAAPWTQIPVMIFRPGDEWLIRTSSGATPTVATYAQVGIDYGIEYVSAGVWCLDTTSTSADVARIVRILYAEDESTVDPHFWAVITWLPSACMYSQGA